MAQAVGNLRRAALAATACVAIIPTFALADDQPAAPPPPPAAPASAAMSTPAMGPTLSANANPANFNAGPLGKIYITGVITGLAMATSDPIAGDRATVLDFSNVQLIVQNTTGPVQFFVEVGDYAFPTVGAPYTRAFTNTRNTFDFAPVAYVKLQPTTEFSIQAGKLPTLIGAESAFTFQNLDIQRGLLWNQEPVVSQGVQVNYAKGPVTLSASVNDGFYSGRLNWPRAV